MKNQFVIVALLLTLARLATAKSNLEAVEKYVATFDRPLIGIDMVVKKILMPRYGQETQDFALGPEDFKDLGSIVSVSLEQISNSLYQYLTRVTDLGANSDLLQNRRGVNEVINAFLVNPCAELERRVGHLIERLGETPAELFWKGKLSVCRKVLGDIQSVQLHVCQLANCKRN